jgi:hypothetical protein
VIDVGRDDKATGAVGDFAEDVANAGSLIDRVDANATEGDDGESRGLGWRRGRGLGRRRGPGRFHGLADPARFCFFNVHGVEHPMAQTKLWRGFKQKPRIEPTEECKATIATERGKRNRYYKTEMSSKNGIFVGARGIFMSLAP